MAIFRGPYPISMIFGFIISSTVIYYLLSNGKESTSVPEKKSTSVLHVDEIGLGREHFFLVVLVLSRPGGRELRDTIRQTWIKAYREKKLGVLVKFSVGTKGLLSRDVERLTSEESIYGDLLLLPDVQDLNNKITWKVLKSFVAISNVYDFTYFLKCDDDTFVVLDTVLSELAKRESKKEYYWGSMIERARVRKSGKKWFLCKTYLPYASGGCYILSRNLVMHIASNSDILSVYESEDVSVSVWISPYVIDRHHDLRFNVVGDSPECNNSSIAIHYETKNDMILRQKSYDEHKVIC